MKLSELQLAMREEFGDGYAGVVLRDHWLRMLGSTASDAFERGVSAREVWRAICVEFDIPRERWHGRGMKDPQKNS